MGKTKLNKRTVERAELNTVKKMKETIKAQQKKISQLQKELGRREDVSDDYREVLNEAASTATYEVTTYKEKCPECQSPVEVIQIGKFNLHRCTECDWRKRK